MLKKVFFTEKRTEPISYEEFSAIGMSKAGYISYIAHCDRLRSALVLHYYADCGIVSSEIKKRKESIKDICQICLDELLRVLQCFCDDNINLADLAREQISVDSLLYNMSYNGSMEVFLGKDAESPALLYVGFDCFRIYIEEILYKLVNHIFPIFSFDVDPDIEDMDLNILKIKAEQKKDYEDHDSEPQFPTKSGKTSDIFEWAEKAERYYNHQCFIQEFEGIEETIARKEALVFDVHKHTLYIFNDNLSCRLKDHPLEPTKATIELPEIFAHMAELDILYCHECKKFFIRETSYELYRKKYVFLPVCFVYDSENKTSSNFKNRAERSSLWFCGYTVSKDIGLNSEERQQLLSWIIDHNIRGLQKENIINHLEMLIDTNGNKPGNEHAKRKWMEDLEFVHRYRIDDQPKAHIQHIHQQNRNKK